MIEFLLKYKIIAFIIALGLILIAIFQGGFYLAKKEVIPSGQNVSENTAPALSESSEPQIISVKPEKLNGSTVPPTQVIEITFNQSTQGFDPKVHIQFEPKVEFVVEQSNESKTITIKPEKLYAVGTEYKLKVMGNLEFTGKKKLGADKEYTFKTIEYRGI